MTTLKSYDTPQLLHILNSRSGGMELVGTEFKNIDELVDATHKELDRRFAERGEFVRLSNKQKTMCGPAYICAKIIDGITISAHYERDEVKAKSYRRVK